MKLAFYACVFILPLLASCKGLQFSESGQTSVPAAEEGDTKTDNEDTVALEPTAVGGAYLACFYDPQIDAALYSGPAEAGSRSVGCQAFDDSNFTHIVGPGSLIIMGTELKTATARQSLSLQTVMNHPRWAWITRVPDNLSGAILYWTVRPGSGAAIVKVRLELLDSLPISMPDLNSGSYRLRVKGTGSCLHGNPQWSWDTTAMKPITESLGLKDCAGALDFHIAAFAPGYRLHTLNPKPYACDTNNFAVEYCSDSCVDLEDYGLGNRFVFFGCTKSVEAQSYTFTPTVHGAFRLQVNGRYMGILDALPAPSLVPGPEFELVPVAPAP